MCKQSKYSAEQLEFLRKGYQRMNCRHLTRAFNERYGVDKTFAAIKSALTNHRITCGRTGKGRLGTCRRIFSPGEEAFVRRHYSNHSLKELASMFRNRFGGGKTLQQIRSYIHNHGINSGRTGRFEKGQKAWNDGVKGYMGPNKTSYKKGSVPANVRPLGAERICPRDGFVLIKIAERNPYTGFPTRFKHKHVYVWEQANGPVPKGMVVAFRDGDKLNTALENLMLISRAELLRLNKHGYKETPAKLKPSVLSLARLEVKTFNRINEKEI